MVEVVRKSLLPLLVAGGLAALGGCSSSGYHSEAAPAPSASYGTRSCTVGPTAGDNAGCDAAQDQRRTGGGGGASGSGASGGGAGGGGAGGGGGGR